MLILTRNGWEKFTSKFCKSCNVVIVLFKAEFFWGDVMFTRNGERWLGGEYHILLEVIQGHGRRWLKGLTKNSFSLSIVRWEGDTTGFTKLSFII